MKDIKFLYEEFTWEEIKEVVKENRLFFSRLEVMNSMGLTPVENRYSAGTSLLSEASRQPLILWSCHLSFWV
jgi:hypothetical protein